MFSPGPLRGMSPPATGIYKRSVWNETRNAQGKIEPGKSLRKGQDTAGTLNRQSNALGVRGMVPGNLFFDFLNFDRQLFTSRCTE